METFSKKRMEIIVEAPIVSMTTALLERNGVRAYTVLPTLRGLGQEGAWSGEGQVGPTGQMMMILAVTTEERMNSMLDDLRAQLQRHFGYVTISDCEVMRSERF